MDSFFTVVQALAFPSTPKYSKMGTKISSPIQGAKWFVLNSFHKRSEGSCKADTPGYRHSPSHTGPTPYQTAGGDFLLKFLLRKLFSGASSRPFCASFRPLQRLARTGVSSLRVPKTGFWHSPGSETENRTKTAIPPGAPRPVRRVLAPFVEMPFVTFIAFLLRS